MTLAAEMPIGSPEEYAYRSKLTPHYQKPVDCALQKRLALKDWP